MGWRQSGHIRPLSVEYTKEPVESRDFIQRVYRNKTRAIKQRALNGGIVTDQVAEPKLGSCYYFCSYLRTFHEGNVPKCALFSLEIRNQSMSRQSVWATKVTALLQGGNSQAALAQIKVAPSVKDLQQLRIMLSNTKLLAQHPNVDAATSDQIVALSSPRLHRSP
jgi:hypothetical protein